LYIRYLSRDRGSRGADGDQAEVRRTLEWCLDGLAGHFLYLFPWKANGGAITERRPMDGGEKFVTISVLADHDCGLYIRSRGQEEMHHSMRMSALLPNFAGGKSLERDNAKVIDSA
jgi:hypothetical protein